MAKEQTVESVLKLIKDKDVKYVDLRFTDPRGKMQHLTVRVFCARPVIFCDEASA